MSNQSHLPDGASHPSPQQGSNTIQADSQLSLPFSKSVHDPVEEKKHITDPDVLKEEVEEIGVVDVARAEAEFAELRRQLTKACVTS